MPTSLRIASQGIHILREEEDESEIKEYIPYKIIYTISSVFVRPSGGEPGWREARIYLSGKTRTIRIPLKMLDHTKTNYEILTDALEEYLTRQGT